MNERGCLGGATETGIMGLKTFWAFAAGIHANDFHPLDIPDPPFFWFLAVLMKKNISHSSSSCTLSIPSSFPHVCTLEVLFAADVVLSRRCIMAPKRSHSFIYSSSSSRAGWLGCLRRSGELRLGGWEAGWAWLKQSFIGMFILSSPLVDHYN